MYGQTSYTPWLPRGLLGAAVFGVNVIDRTTNASVTASVYHRDSEDTDNGALLGSTATLVTPGALSRSEKQ